MAYDEKLAERVWDCLEGVVEVREQKMFGGLAFMVRGHMTIGVMHDQLMVKLGKEDGPLALQEPHTKMMDFTGRPMPSMIYVLPAGIKTKAQLKKWVDRALRFNATQKAK